MDRFSRSGDNAITILSELEKIGIIVCPATDGSVKEGHSDQFIKNIRLLVAKDENDRRSRKCNEGTLSRLNDGYWIGVPTKGYEKVDKKTLKFGSTLNVVGINLVPHGKIK